MLNSHLTLIASAVKSRCPGHHERLAGILSRPAALEGARDDPLKEAQPLHAVLPDLAPHGVDQLIRDEPVAELRVFRVDVVGGVDQMRVVPVSGRHRRAPSGVICGLGEAEHPARHRDRDPLAGEVADQGIHHFGLTSRPRYTAARRRTSFSCSSSRILFFVSRNSADSA